MEEVFAFAECADPDHEVQWNIESKINAQFPYQTRSVDDFVLKQHDIFTASVYRNSITVRCFRDAHDHELTSLNWTVSKFRLAHSGRDEEVRSDYNNFGPD
jgi:hypothetical protein